jgi:FkbM family methyltransferase
MRGVAAAVSNRLFGIPKQLNVFPSGLKHRVHLRLRTSDVSLYDGLLLKGTYELELPFIPATIVDAGANVGMASLYYAKRYPRAKIASVAPEPSNYAMLAKNVAAYPNVIAVNAALWDSDRELFLAPINEHLNPKFDKWAFGVSSSGTPVRGLTMKTLMQETGLDRIDLLKMDVEGGEIEVFADSRLDANCPGGSY